jgi:hypothetical protein
MKREDNVVSVFKPSDNSAKNLENFIEINKKSIFVALFEHTLNWESQLWDIKGFESTTRAPKANQAKKIRFTQFNGLRATKIKASDDVQEPFAEPFQSFVKAHITHRHHAKRKTKDNHMVTVRAYRYLYEQLPAGRKDVGMLTAGHFDSAAQAAVKRESASSAYRVGVALAEIAKLLQTHKLTPMAIRWKNPIPRATGGSGKADRNSQEAEAQRAKMLPKTEVLIYLAALWDRYDALEEQDKSLLCIAIILLFAGFRIDEVLGLDVDCLSMDREFNPTLGIYQRVMKIRVLAKKSAQWTTKKIPDSAQQTIQEAIQRLQGLTEKHRTAARLLLQEGQYHKLAHLEDGLLLDARELMGLLGTSSVSNTHTVMKNRKIEPTGKETRHRSARPARVYRVGDIHTAIHREFTRRYPDMVKGFGNSDFRIPLWKLLTLRFTDEFSPKGAPQWYPLPISQNVTQDFFRGRDYLKRVSREEARIRSVFERYEMEHIEGSALSVHSHQFRHLLNTLMQESDVFEEYEIARYFLRNRIGDNAAYNHQLAPTNLVENSKKNIEKVLAQSQH